MNNSHMSYMRHQAQQRQKERDAKAARAVAEGKRLQMAGRAAVAHRFGENARATQSVAAASVKPKAKRGGFARNRSPYVR